MEERRLGKLEAVLGLLLIAALLLALGWTYVDRLETPVKAIPPDPNWASAERSQPSGKPIEQTAFRPEWLTSQQGDDGRAVFR